MAGLFLLTFVLVKLLLQTQGQNIQHAKIYSLNKEVAEGGSIQVTCSTFGYTIKRVFIYLCHNGKAIEMKKQPSQGDVSFMINNIEKNNSGNYSCIFSEEHFKTTQVTGYGANYVFINVTGSLIPAEIRLLKSEVSEGSNAEFNCSISNPANMIQPRKMILAFLLKNGRIIQVNTQNTTETMTTFTLRKVQIEDAGAYSCVVMLNILPHLDKRLCGKNEVNLQITEINPLIPAEIRLLKSDLSEGSDAVFKCITSNPLNLIQPRKMILAFLIKNGRIIQVNTQNTTETMTTFTLRKVQIEDAGAYSCVVMLNILPHLDKRLCGKNEVKLQIAATSVSYSYSEVRLAIICFIMLLVISLLLGMRLGIQKRGLFGWLSKRCLENEEQRRGTEVVYEEPAEAEATGETQSVCELSEWNEFSDSAEAEATGETQSVCELSEWNEFSDSEEDQHVYQLHPDMEERCAEYATVHKNNGCESSL